MSATWGDRHEDCSNRRYSRQPASVEGGAERHPTQAVDETVCLGDLAFKGPAPGACVKRLRTLGIPCVYGNTDLALLHVAGHPSAPELPDGYTIPPAEVPYLEWHLARMSGADIEYLASLPFELRAEADGHSIQFVHASLLDCNAAIRPFQAPETVRERLRGCDADWVVMGHTHEPFLLGTGRQWLVNVGAVGFSLDGDWRPAYAVLDTERGSLLHQRVAYDVAEAVALANDTDFCFSPQWYEQALRKGWWEPIPWEKRAAIDQFPRKDCFPGGI